MRQLSEKVVLITGASKGIGTEIANQFAAGSTRVIVNYASSQTDADKLINKIKQQGGNAIAIQADVSKSVEASRLFDDAIAHFG